MAYRCPLADDLDCEGKTNMRCFACGEPICRSCSRMVVWHSFGVRRIGLDCLRDDIKTDRKLEMEAYI